VIVIGIHPALLVILVEIHVLGQPVVMMVIVQSPPALFVILRLKHVFRQNVVLTVIVQQLVDALLAILALVPASHPTAALIAIAMAHVPSVIPIPRPA